MRKFILASAVALGASLTLGASASHADVTVRLGDSGHYYHRHHDHLIGRVGEHHRHHRDCMTKTVVTHRHGDRIVKKTRVCR